MRAVSPLSLSRPTTKDWNLDQGDIDISTCSTTTTSLPWVDFPEFTAPGGVGCLLESIDFDDLIHDGFDMLPDLEVDTDFMAKFSVFCPSYDVGDRDEDSAATADTGIQVVPDCYVDDNDNNNANRGCWNYTSKKVEGKVSAMEAGIKDDDIDSENSTISTPPAKEREKPKKLPSSQAKKNNNSNNNNQGKRKTKVPNGVTPSTSCFPQTQTPRFKAAPPVPNIPPPHATMYKPDHSPPTSAKPGPSHPPLDHFPMKGSIDAAIGDVLTKPWLPLPIGLKPPSTDSVMVELQRQGIPKIPPSCS